LLFTCTNQEIDKYNAWVWTQLALLKEMV